jgi:hypothetical protein
MYQAKLQEYLKLNLSTIKDYPEFNPCQNSADVESICQNTDMYHSMISYIAGNCYFNGKLSHNAKLIDNELKMTNDLDCIVSKLKPIPYPLYLFHGFEPGINYGDHNWTIGKVIKFPFHLSKTPAIWIADRFTNHYSWKKKNDPTIPECYNISLISRLKTLFHRKYLFCIYPENQFSHITTDIRCPPDLIKINPSLIMNEEFEYLSNSGETFKLIDIYSRRTGLIWKTFYIMERIKMDTS